MWSMVFVLMFLKSLNTVNNLDFIYIYFVHIIYLKVYIILC